MPLQVHRMSDCNTGGGCITSIPQSTVFANNLLVCVNGSIGTSHPPCPKPSIHCAGNWVTTSGGPTVFAEGIEQIRLPRGATISAVVRGDEVLMAHHDTVIQADDHVIIFMSERRQIDEVERLFEVGANFV